MLNATISQNTAKTASTPSLECATLFTNAQTVSGGTNNFAQTAFFSTPKSASVTGQKMSNVKNLNKILLNVTFHAAKQVVKFSNVVKNASRKIPLLSLSLKNALTAFTHMKLNVTNISNAPTVTDGKIKNAPRAFFLTLRSLSVTGPKMLTVVTEIPETQTAANQEKVFSQSLRNATLSTSAPTDTGKARIPVTPGFMLFITHVNNLKMTDAPIYVRTLIFVEFLAQFLELYCRTR